MPVIPRPDEREPFHADLTESLKFRKNSAELHRLLETAYTGLPDPQMAEEHRQRAIELEAALVAH